MHTRFMLVGALGLVVGTSEAHASGFSRFNYENHCNTGSLVTCASVQVRFARMVESSPSGLRVGLRNLGGNQDGLLHEGTQFQGSFPGVNNVEFDRPNILSRFDADTDCPGPGW